MVGTLVKLLEKLVESFPRPGMNDYIQKPMPK